MATQKKDDQKKQDAPKDQNKQDPKKEVKPVEVVQQKRLVGLSNLQGFDRFTYRVGKYMKVLNGGNVGVSKPLDVKENAKRKILRVLADAPEGLNSDAIASRADYHKRQIQNYLPDLILEGKVKIGAASGDARKKLYFLA